MRHPTPEPAGSGHAPAPTGALPPQEAVIFEMDGVVTDTATMHAEAWRRLFDTVLADPRASGADSTEPFDTDADYRRYIDGRAQQDGVTAFLCLVTGLLEALDPGKDESHGSTEEVPR